MTVKQLKQYLQGWDDETPVLMDRGLNAVDDGPYQIEIGRDNMFLAEYPYTKDNSTVIVISIDYDENASTVVQPLQEIG